MNTFQQVGAQEKKRYQLLNEVYDLTAQLAEAIDRGDRASVSMLISMRQQPILSLQELDEHQQMLLSRLTDEQALMRVLGVLQGGPSQEAESEALVKQVAQNRRLRDKLLTLDRRASQRLNSMKSK